jgi:hypothetical protein
MSSNNSDCLSDCSEHSSPSGLGMGERTRSHFPSQLMAVVSDTKLSQETAAPVVAPIVAPPTTQEDAAAVWPAPIHGQERPKVEVVYHFKTRYSWSDVPEKLIDELKAGDVYDKIKTDLSYFLKIPMRLFQIVKIVRGDLTQRVEFMEHYLAQNPVKQGDVVDTMRRGALNAEYGITKNEKAMLDDFIRCFDDHMELELTKSLEQVDARRVSSFDAADVAAAGSQ